MSRIEAWLLPAGGVRLQILRSQSQNSSGLAKRNSWSIVQTHALDGTSLSRNQTSCGMTFSSKALLDKTRPATKTLENGACIFACHLSSWVPGEWCLNHESDKLVLARGLFVEKRPRLFFIACMNQCCNCSVVEVLPLRCARVAV